ncbi:MAG TPA: polysaccharide deacetylase family protein [Bacteroidia bacterium]|nr:polysaccharide deacetylase family protein [Bacteroidia bacterium]
MNSILLSFDLEEFDIPEEFGQKLSNEEKMNITLSGLIPVLQLLDKHNIKATFYTTAFFAETNPEIVKKVAEKHEIASHGFYHSSFQTDHIAKSKEVLEKITSTAVKGFRMTRLMPVDKSLLVNAGYIYDSSLNPTFIPGRYNNMGKPRKPFNAGGLINLPASVATFIRIPLFWISFKNFPFNFFNALALRTLKKDKYLNLYFHPWEFADISSYKLPGYVKRISGKEMLVKFEKLLVSLKEQGEFVGTSAYCDFYLKNAAK